MNNVIKLIFGGERTDVRNLVKVAYAKGAITELDIDYLNRELDYLNLSEEQAKSSRKSLSKLVASLPKEPFKIYELLFNVTKKLMQTNMLTDKKEHILQGLTTVLVKNAKSVAELIHFLKYNIQYGNSLKDSYTRLGYLLK